MDSLHEQADVSTSALDCRGREAGVYTMAGASGTRQPRFGPLLALRGCSRLALDRLDLSCGTGPRPSVAAARPDFMDGVSAGMGCRVDIPAPGSPAAGQSLQRAPAVDVFRSGLRAHATSDSDRV